MPVTCTPLPPGPGSSDCNISRSSLLHKNITRIITTCGCTVPARRCRASPAPGTATYPGLLSMRTRAKGPASRRGRRCEAQRAEGAVVTSEQAIGSTRDQVRARGDVQRNVSHERTNVRTLTAFQARSYASTYNSTAYRPLYASPSIETLHTLCKWHIHVCTIEISNECARGPTARSPGTAPPLRTARSSGPPSARLRGENHQIWGLISWNKNTNGFIIYFHSSGPPSAGMRGKTPQYWLIIYNGKPMVSSCTFIAADHPAHVGGAPR